MARVKGGNVARKRRKKILKLAKGYLGSKHLLYRTANEQVMKSLAYAYRDRKARKRNFRKLWITRINAAARLDGMSYSRLIDGLNKAGVEVNRKMLADIAIEDPKGFSAIVAIAKDGLAGKVHVAGKVTPKAAPKKEVAKEVKEEVITEEVVTEVDELSSKTVTELKELAKDRGLSGYSALKKAELIDLLK
jgi:large subunit ribosomal protein L20